MPKEIERKFITDHMGEYYFSRCDQRNKVHSLIFQIYTSFSPEIRFRAVIEESYDNSNKKQESVKFIKTMKSGEGLVREEVETEITGTEFFLAFEETKAFLVKLRIERKDMPGVSLDTYLDNLKVMEFEFDSEEQAIAFNPKNYEPFSQMNLKEVTGDKTYSNSSLAKNRYSYVNHEGYLKAFTKLYIDTTGNETLEMFATSFVVNKDNYSQLSKNLYPTQCFVSVNQFNSLFIKKGTKKGVPGKVDLNFYGVKGIVLKMTFSEELALEVYKREKEKELKFIDEHLERVNQLKSSIIL